MKYKQDDIADLSIYTTRSLEERTFKMSKIATLLRRMNASPATDRKRQKRKPSKYKEDIMNT